MEKILCDICKDEFSDVYRGVRIDDPIAVRIGGHHYPDVCKTCYKLIFEFAESLKK